MKEQIKNKESYLKETVISGLFLIERPVYKDERGFFHELLRLTDIADAGVSFHPVQLNHSVSKPGVIRAIHTEYWQKLVYPVTGKMFAAFVDTRTESNTFGKVETMVIDCEQDDSLRTAIFIPAGVGNSICVMGDKEVNYIYAVDEYWSADKAQGIAWDDADLNIDWPVENPIISQRDQNNPTMRQLFPEKYI